MGLYKYFVFFYAAVCFLMSDVLCSIYHYRLLDELLKDYSYLVRPVKDPTTVTNVHLEFFLAQVIEMDEKKQTLKINAWLTLRWVDEYLQWNSTAHGGVYNLKIPSEQIWMPDVVLYDNADDHYYNFMKGKIAVVYNDGEIMWASPVILHSHCQIDVTYFPFDKQECRLKFGPWQHEGTEVNVTGGGDQSVFTSDGEWDMTGVTTKNNVEFYPDAPGIPYTDVTFYIHLKRRSLYYVFNLIMPCGLISGVTLLTFLLPPESGEKISLAITVLLSLTVFLLLVAETMPPASVVPVIGQYYAGTMVTVTLSLAMSVAVLKIHYKSPEGNPMPTWLKRIIHGRVGRFFGISKVEKKPKAKSNGMELSHKVNMTLDGSICNIVRRMDGNDSPIFGRKPNGNVRSGKPKPATLGPHEDCPVMHHLLAEFRRVSSFYDWKNRHEHAQNEWRLCAILLDRIFMIIYLLCCLSTVLIICIQLDYS
ncbi:neuronal acetylcholine receptor subunit alpha-10-like [Ptychodera flava]|uniref:neuronal acetylcholine receptor subunit alpha-10-like n=1 Tax=Ptychodera flava TaxID=63121 RepID=UPI00396A019D